ncbi:UDP-N-acetylglucosamine 2-epimerase [Anaeroselena agilis]|uniref:UDP-N-acetylglucosamine 2-epimerase n=1 Tax=Anaeroselena agilis TaxID=3063788 RepID=A0ABU3P457_9FIRM|nr:UDP-N-acetylglucosamine 2-epimerase [Selenomonadales bacterium 4137-cl]
MRKICVVTGTRAEYGLLYPIMKRIQDEPTMELQIVATGAHLSPEFGLTYKCIESDGFTIDAKVEMLLSSDTAVGVAKSIGLGVIGFAEVLDRLNSDILVVLGDRYEILAAVQAAMVARIPVAHIAGGDTTEGAIDEAIRHSITKMAHLHFVTNQQAANRVRQMGEDPQHIFCVGSPGIDAIKETPLLSRQELATELDFTFLEKNLLITYHPVTLESAAAKWQIEELLKALDYFGPTMGLIITKPNADTDGRIISEMIDSYVAGRTNAKAFVSLGQLRYLSTIAQVDVVVGNSSSGLYEVPSFKKPTVNIGDRQKGRLAAKSVIHSGYKSEEIRDAIHQALGYDCYDIENPYGDGNSASQIVAILNSYDNYKLLLKKHFYEWVVDRE